MHISNCNISTNKKGAKEAPVSQSTEALTGISYRMFRT